MATTNIFAMTDTWNNAATTFTAIQMNVTDTASAAGSKLLDLQVGGVSKFRINKTGGGSISVGGEHAAGSIASPQGAMFSWDNGGWWGVSNFSPIDGASRSSFEATGGVIGHAGLAIGSDADVKLMRDAANILAQRDGVNAQSYRLYNTYTDAANYECAVFDWTTTPNVLTIGTKAAGTGAARAMKITSATKAISYDTATVATLPAAATAGAGARSFVTDANAATFGTTVAAGGANAVPVWSDGANWKIG